MQKLLIALIASVITGFVVYLLLIAFNFLASPAQEIIGGIAGVILFASVISSKQ